MKYRWSLDLRTMMLVTFVTVAFLALVPVSFLLFGSFWSASPGLGGSFTLANYLSVYGNPVTYKALLNTILYAVGASAEALLIGTPLAWIIARTDTPYSRFFEVTSLIPFMYPGVLYAVSWVFFLDPHTGLLSLISSGLLGVSIHFPIYSLYGMIWTDGLTGVPIAVIFLVGPMRNQAGPLEDAALVAGSGTLGMVRRVTLPLVMPAILAAFTINILRYFQLLGVPLIIGLAGGVYVLSTLIYAQISGLAIPDYGTATALGVIAVLVSVWFVYIYRRMTKWSERFVVITGKSSEARPINLGRWRYATLAFCLGVFFLIGVVPLIALVLGAFLPYWGVLAFESFFTALSHASLSHFYFAFSFSFVSRAFVNSILLSVIGATFCMGVSISVGYLVSKTRVGGRGTLENLSFLPFAVPGVVIGVGFLWAYSFIPIPIIGTIFILLLSYVTRFLPYGVRSVTSNVVQIHKELEESSRVAGSSLFGVIRRVILPLSRQGLIGGWILLAIVFLQELDSSILLYGRGSEVLSVAMYNLFVDTQWEAVAAIGLVTLIISVSMSLIAFRLAKSESIAVA